MTVYPYIALTTTERQALVDYVATHGRTWRAHLATDWQSARVPEGPVLRHLRDRVAPSQLRKLSPFA